MRRALSLAVPLLLALPGPVPAQLVDPPSAVDAREIVPVAPERAQRPEPVGDDQELNRPLRLIFKDIAGDFAGLVSWKSAAWVGGSGALALAVHPFDDELTSPPGEEWAKWSEIFDPGTYIGNFYVLAGASSATYAFGSMTNRPRAAHVGRDLLRTQVVSQLLVQGIKAAVPRDRPDLSGDNSFPSGHAASTFASAVVFQRHLGKKWAIATYSVATYVAISRMHENKHHLSDVVFGAGLGIASGYSTTRHATAQWALAPVKVPGGVALMVSKVRWP
jgi:membrane-associated phospholipid phosphatase